METLETEIIIFWVVLEQPEGRDALRILRIPRRRLHSGLPIRIQAFTAAKLLIGSVV
jgi:hypothetical protein